MNIRIIECKNNSIEMDVAKEITEVNGLIAKQCDKQLGFRVSENWSGGFYGGR